MPLVPELKTGPVGLIQPDGTLRRPIFVTQVLRPQWVVTMPKIISRVREGSLKIGKISTTILATTAKMATFVFLTGDQTFVTTQMPSD